MVLTYNGFVSQIQQQIQIRVFGINPTITSVEFLMKSSFDF